MRVYLAGSGLTKVWQDKDFFDFYRLQTFYHITDKEASDIHKYKGFLLDSGAFSFFGGETVNWTEYVQSYIDFINKYDVKHFFELDIYSIIGVDKTEAIREKIIRETGKKPIPVWHIELGIDYFKMLCDNFSYVAIGASGQHDSRWTRTTPKNLQLLIGYARSKKVKIHGLGYTVINMLPKMKFDSVDSTSWLSGNRFGAIYRFNGTGFDKISKPKGKRVKTAITADNNFYEWIKFQKYADEKL